MQTKRTLFRERPKNRIAGFTLGRRYNVHARGTTYSGRVTGVPVDASGAPLSIQFSDGSVLPWAEIVFARQVSG